MDSVWTTAVFVYILYVGTALSSDNEIAVNTSGCPKGCTCTSDMYDCSNANFKEMLNGTDESIRTLDMSGNEIKRTLVLDASSLIYLSLANNLLTTLRYDTFDNLDELKTLVLSNNLLTRITDDIFEWNPLKLEVLRLDGNQIEFIQHFLFYDLEQLTELDMHDNKITFIHPHAFLQLKKLTKLRLDGNHLHTFDSKWFKGLRANMFSLMNLTSNPWACDCTMKQQVPWLTTKKGRWVSKVLTNPLQCQLPSGLFGRPVTYIVNMTDLQCDTPDITGISQPTSLYVNQSIELDCVINKTRLPVPSIMWIAPNKDHYNLQTADRFEGIEVFQNGTMIIHLVKLDDQGEYKCVATNNVSSVQAFTNLTITIRPEHHAPGKKGDLQKSHTIAADDHDRVVDSSCPKSCTCVSQHVDCSSDDPKNGLTDITYGVIPKNTVTLNLASNSIQRILKAPANRFDSLTELRLDNNQISHIDSHAFDNLHLLQTLTLRDNKIATLPGRLFRRLDKLTILVLDNNLLTTIDDHTFYGLSSLQWIYIRSNLITSISPNAFASVPDVKFIHMEHNELSTIPKETITTLTEPPEKSPKIQKIFVDNNQFNCDCKLQSLKDYLAGNPQWRNLFGDGISCSFPPELHELVMQDIVEKLPCDSLVFTVGGSDSSGKQCHFPFEYNNQMYNTCIEAVDDPKSPSSGAWCATTASFDTDGRWGVCPSQTKDITIVKVQKKTNPGAMSGLWFGGLIVGLILCAVIFVLWRKYGHKVGIKSMQYSNLPGDDINERQAFASGNSGSEAFV